jgi:tryptophan 2,3-dioxygenase
MIYSDSTQDILSDIKQKYDAIDQKLDTQLEGLLWSKPMTYWDYIHTDSLLNLQIQRTTLPDEMVFIMYHQINELTFKMILWEINQIATNDNITVDFFAEKLERISRYFDMLTNTFGIMENGMNVQQYMKFRNTLTPASGFQSAQYRLIEFGCTDIINLIDYRFRKSSTLEQPTEDLFEKLYWQAAGKNHETGEKSYLLTEFEKKYKSTFLQTIDYHKERNIWEKYKQLPQEVQLKDELIKAMRHLDYTINITWVMQHYKVAVKYIDHSGIGDGEATGGSEWRKYMHPKYQKRIFFPELWSDSEIQNWGLNL